MNTPLIEPPSDAADVVKRFRAMADRIEANGIGAFGGAFVVVAPTGAVSFETLILDATQDPAQFYAILKTKCEMALMGLDEQQRNTSAFGRR